MCLETPSIKYDAGTQNAPFLLSCAHARFVASAPSISKCAQRVSEGSILNVSENYRNVAYPPHLVFYF